MTLRNAPFSTSVVCAVWFGGAALLAGCGDEDAPASTADAAQDASGERDAGDTGSTGDATEDVAPDVPDDVAADTTADTSPSDAADTPDVADAADVGGGPLTAEPGTLTFRGEVDGAAFAATCRVGAGFGDPLDLSVQFAGANLNVKCPAVPAVGLEHPNFVIAFVRFDAAAETYAFGADDVNPQNTDVGFNVSAGAGPGRALHAASDFAQAVSVEGTFDPVARQLVGTFDGTWDGAGDGELGDGNGFVQAAWNVTVP